MANNSKKAVFVRKPVIASIEHFETLCNIGTTIVCTGKSCSSAGK